jgi:hypothetical protein
MTSFRVKGKQDRDFSLIIRFLLYWAMAVGTLLTIGIWTAFSLFSFTHFFVFSLGAVPPCFILALLVEKLGAGFGGFLSGWSSRKAPARATLSADLARARYSKAKGEFSAALRITNGILETAPDFPEALYLKAQVLREGFDDFTGAKECLKQVLQQVPREDPLHRWASSYWDEMAAAEKKARFSVSEKEDGSGP